MKYVDSSLLWLVSPDSYNLSIQGDFMSKALSFCLLFCCTVFTLASPSGLALASPGNVGYTRPARFTDLPVFRFYPSDDASDTQRLTDLINEVSNTLTTGPNGRQLNGGRIFITNGVYTLRQVELKSNVHLRFGQSVDILYDTAPTREFRGPDVFSLSGGVENVSIVGSGRNPLRIFGPPIPDSPFEGTRFRAVAITGATNFLIRNLFIDNAYSRFSTIFLGGENAARGNVDGPFPNGGEISNIQSYNNSGGFGVVQMHAGARVKFQNVGGTGGVSLRFESGIATLHGVQDVAASDIWNVDGRAGVLFQPHAVTAHNRIDIRNVVTTGSAFSVEILGGFVSSRDRALNRPEFLQRGRFNNLSISNIEANYGSGYLAQLRPNRLHTLPEEFLPAIPSFEDFLFEYRFNDDTVSTTPVGAVYNEALTYTPVIQESSIRCNGFPPALGHATIKPDTPARNSVSQDLARAFRALEREVEESIE